MKSNTFNGVLTEGKGYSTHYNLYFVGLVAESQTRLSSKHCQYGPEDFLFVHHSSHVLDADCGHGDDSCGASATVSMSLQSKINGAKDGPTLESGKLPTTRE